MTSTKRIGDPDRRRRRPRPQLGHQERRLPGDRGRLRGPRHPARLGGPDPRPARAPDGGDPDYLRPLDRINTRTIDRTGGTMLHTSRTNPRKMRGRRPAAMARPRPDRAMTIGRRRLRPDAARPRAHRARSGIDVLVTIGGDDTLSLLAGPGRRGRAARRDPQDDGQRRPGHRVLHRLLDRDHPGEGGDQPAADDARLARADRRVPDLRPRRRVLGAVHRLRHVGAGA